MTLVARCQRCNGRGNILGNGGMVKECPECGINVRLFSQLDAPPEPVRDGCSEKLAALIYAAERLCAKLPKGDSADLLQFHACVELSSLRDVINRVKLGTPTAEGRAG